MDGDPEFYERRIVEEQAAAASAVDQVVRDRHIQLADLYAERLKAMSARDDRERPTLRVVFDDNASQRA